MRSRKTSPSTRWKGLFAAALSLALVLLAAAGYAEGWFRLPREAFPGGPPEEEGLTLFMADVGQGLAMLLQCGGESAVIDAGPPGTAEDFAREVAVRAPEGLKYVFLTHPHQDHCGGAKALFSAVEAETLVISDCGDREAALIQAGDWLGASDAQIDFTSAGREYTLGGAKLTVLHPGPDFESDDANEWSLVIRAEYAGTALLFTGDQVQPVENSLIPLERVDILQVGHHGSNTSSGQAFLENIAPDLALISVGAGNSYGHPHKKVLQRLRETGAEILRTDQCGAITVTVAPDGSWSFQTERGERRGAAPQGREKPDFFCKKRLRCLRCCAIIPLY